MIYFYIDYILKCFEYTELKYIITINFTFFFLFLNVATGKFKIACVVCVVFLTDGAGLACVRNSLPSEEAHFIFE